MKKFFVVSLALASSMSFAAEVDYSRCQMFAGVQLDHEGRVVGSDFQKIKSQRTEGNKEYVVLEGSYGTQKFETQVTIERDAQGRIIKSTTGGDRPSAQTMKQYKEMMVTSAVMMAPSNGGFMSQEPSYWVKKNRAAVPSEGSTGGTAGGMVGGSMGGMPGGVVGGMMDPNYEMVPLSKLTKEQALSVGIEDAEELKRLRQQWKRDKKTTKKLRDTYSKIVDRSSLVIPMGSESEFEIKDSVCYPKSMNSRFYNSQSGQVNTFPVSSKESCEKVKNVYKRHERKIQECQTEGQKVTMDYYKEMYPQGGMVGGYTGGAYMAGGIAGGMNMGMGGAYLAGGMGGGMVGGYMGGMGGYGMGGMYMGGDMNSIAAQNTMCEFTYNRPAAPQRNEGSTGGSGSEVQQQ